MKEYKSYEIRVEGNEITNLQLSEKAFKFYSNSDPFSIYEIYDVDKDKYLYTFTFEKSILNRPNTSNHEIDTLISKAVSEEELNKILEEFQCDEECLEE